MNDPSHPRNAATIDALGQLVKALFCRWLEPPSELRDRLTQAVRQARCDLAEVAAAASLDPARMEKIALATFRKIRLSTESLN